MTFGNAIIGGDGELVRDQIRSRNYVLNVSGWIIRRDGTAEFVGLIIRTGGTGKRIEIGAGGANRIDFYSGLAGEDAPGYLLVDVAGGPPADEGYVELAAPSLDGGSVPRLTLNSTDPASGSNAALESPGSVSVFALGAAEISGTLINLNAADDVTVAAERLVIDGTPATIASTAGDLVLDPASDTVSLAQGQAIKRGGLAAPSFQNGWGNFGSTFQVVRYIEYPDRTGGLTGVADGGTITSGTIMFNVPAQIRPAADHVFIVPSGGGRKAQVVVQSDGDVLIQSPDAGTTWLGLSGCRWPITGF